MTLHAKGRPRIKPEHRAYRTVDGHVRIGSVVHGIGSEVKDPDGWVWTLVEAMDGTRSAEEIVAEVTRRHPGPRLPAADVARAMTDLTEAGFVEDAAAPPPAELSARERERYSRGMTLLRWMDLRPRNSPWEPQLLLRRARVLLIGVGGTGGAAARDLVASGVGHLHCVDPDVVELSNLNRQTLFREDDLGMPKVDAALTALRALNPYATVTGERREVRRPADLAALLNGADDTGIGDTGKDHGGVDDRGVGHSGVDGHGDGDTGRDRNHKGIDDRGDGDTGIGLTDRRVGRTRGRGPSYDVLLLAADRPAAIRRWANQVCLASGMPWAEAGYRGPLVSVGVFVPGRGACWECLRLAEAERRDLRLGPGQDEEAASPRMPWNPVNAVTASLSGSLLAQAALTLLCGIPPTEPGHRFGLNLMVPGEGIIQRADRRADCPACGTEPVTHPRPAVDDEPRP